MTSRYDNLGQTFKKIRTNRHISLKQIADEEVSISQLSRFERGESELSLRRFLIALERMGVEVGEYMDTVNEYQRSEQIQLMNRVIQLEYERNIPGFQEEYERQCENYKDHPDIYRYHLNAILLQGFICKCDTSIPFPKEYTREVTEYLLETEQWNIYELILIGNLYLFFDLKLLHMMGKEILKRKEIYQGKNSQRNVVEITMLNIWESCLHRDTLDMAEFYREKTKELLDDETDLYKRAIFLFLSGLQLYKEGKKAEGKEEMQKAISVFEWVGSENLAQNYKKDYHRFVEE